MLISVYYKENAENFCLAFDSLVEQTLLPDEIVLVKDGPLTDELDSVLLHYQKILPIKLIVLEQNMSLGFALREGLKHCTYDWVGRMDTDDICHPKRFEKQVNFILENPQIELVGANISEFVEVPGDLNRKKTVPEKHDDIVRYAFFRSPFNHPTIFFKKSAVASVGSYQPMLLFEDYYLWLKLIKEGFRFHNLQEELLFFRLGKDMLGRRVGLKYAVDEANFFIRAYREELIPMHAFLRFLMRFPIRIMPRFVTLYFYKKFLRK